MFYVEMICSDEACADSLETSGELVALEALVCDGCGCTLCVVSISEVEVLELRPRFEPALALAA